MSLPDTSWEQLINYIREKTTFLLDNIPLENVALHDELNITHKGFYVGVVGNNINIREGFLRSQSFNILDSVDECIKSLFEKLQSGVLSKDDFEQSKIFLTVVHDVVYTENPIGEWDENKEGVSFQWGSRYKGLYLPYEVAKMTNTKVEILDKLCCWEMGVPSTLWKLPEMQKYRVICGSYEEK